jgi:hypothetical protein
MKLAFAVAAGLLLSAATGSPVLAGGLAVQRAQDSANSATVSPYLPGAPVWGSPYISGPVLGGVFYDGPTDEAVGARVFSPAAGVACSLRRRACWTPTGIDRGWTARFFGLKS